MAVHVLTFDRGNDDTITNPFPACLAEPTYSKIWSYLKQEYGPQINKDGNGACFRGPKGETAVLVDNSLTSSYQELVLVNVNSSVFVGLEKIIEESKK